MNRIRMGPRDKQFIEGFSQEKWEMKTLEEISGGNIFYGNRDVTQSYQDIGDVPAITFSCVLESSICIRDCNLLVHSSCMKDQTSAITNDLIIILSDFLVDNIAKSCAYLGTCKCVVGHGLAVMKHSQNAKYLAYMMSTQVVKQQIKNLYKPATRPRINLSDLKEIKIPLPNLSIQNEIVEILDKFVELKNEIKEEMERRNGKKKWKEEMERRNKQYEYYKEIIFS